MTFRSFLLALLLALGGRESLGRDIVVASYNVENYVGDTVDERGVRRTRAKSPESIEAMIRIIKEINPDILGVCEMGRPELFEDFKKRLDAAGLGYVDSEYVQGPDEERHLALLSRFPIVERQSQRDVSYELHGAVEKVKRGFLDVTVRIDPKYELRLVGAHLKSKLSSQQGEALMRRNEAQLLRKHLDGILTASPNANLLVYGDFNDTKNEPAVQEIMGPRGSPTHMADLWAKDALGDRWTYYWRTADVYSRIDFFFASPGLFREVVKNKSTVYRSDDWSKASDHRAIHTTIRAVDR